VMTESPLTATDFVFLLGLLVVMQRKHSMGWAPSAMTGTWFVLRMAEIILIQLPTWYTLGWLTVGIMAWFSVSLPKATYMWWIIICSCHIFGVVELTLIPRCSCSS
jgi:hypothetical protein